jgi:hypothetical protein
MPEPHRALDGSDSSTWFSAGLSDPLRLSPPGRRGWEAGRNRQPIFSASSMMIPSGPRT